jgi:hypothetical protein
MKKIISMVLTLALVALIGIPAFAATTDYTTGETKPAGKIYCDGVEVGNIFDNRITITCGDIIYPGVGAGNYSDAQLAVIAKRWITFTVYPNGMMPMVFGSGVEWTFKGISYKRDIGEYVYIGSKVQTIKIREGELVLWGNLEDLGADITNRVTSQIVNGNLDYENQKLNFKVCSAIVAGYFPEELLKTNGVEIIDP